MGDDTFFTHFIVGAGLVLGLLTVGLVLVILASLWEAGFATFVVVLGLIGTFSWIVHKLASSETVRKWIKNL